MGPLARIWRSRLGRVALVVAGVLAVPAAALAWWLGSPLFLNRSVDERFPLTANAELPTGVTREEAEAVMSTMAKMDTDRMDEPMAQAMATARVLASGAFHDADGFHKGSGRATLYRLADGETVLRLEDFRVTNGPDLHVLLSAGTDPDTPAAVKDGGYLDLGGIKGNIGNQNYDVPAGTDVVRFRWAVIYCKPFHVVFAVAPLTLAR